MTTISWVARPGTKPETWNAFVGCSLVSPGCTNCYAMHVAGWIDGMGQTDRYRGTVKEVNGRPVWTGLVKRSAPNIFEAPLRWNKPRTVFANSMSDLFHESISDEDIDAAFAVMALTPRHTYQVLTKRPARMLAYFNERWQGTPASVLHDWEGDLQIPAGGETGRRSRVEEACEPFLQAFGLVNLTNDDLWTPEGSPKAMQWQWPLPNVWIGISAEDQQRLVERWPLLRDTPAAVRFISAEPLLGPLDLAAAGVVPRAHHHPDNKIANGSNENRTAIGALVRAALRKMSDTTVYADWVIVGGESGPRARPFDLHWARSLRNQCQTTGTSVFIKQMGAVPSDGGRSITLADKKGEDTTEWPEDLRVQEWPA